MLSVLNMTSSSSEGEIKDPSLLEDEDDINIMDDVSMSKAQIRKVSSYQILY